MGELSNHLDRQSAGRAAGDAALEELTKEFQACSAARYHPQQHEEQRYDLCHSKEHCKGGALVDESKVEGHR